ncbi:pentatricopeptide repeat-containing protein At3g53700, chloroplastic-like [Humulus lupulus]|uniref:pentatricopeptide repeat-containing protein At3g53700, chloroplastic-like n=1 Tax=Humulus lupulus TaxID=3486 RepID=UPI002B40E1FA|nr:pentatricopeptide repeat-containing protein At3g53700, chloroplastic-like [Humulus lupulus]
MCCPWSLPHSLNHRSFNFNSNFNPNSPSSSQSQHQPLPPDLTSKQLLDTLRCQKDESSALRIFDWASKQPNFSPTTSIYQEILCKLAKVGSFDSMTNLLLDMKRSACPVDKESVGWAVERRICVIKYKSSTRYTSMVICKRRSLSWKESSN